MENQKPTPKNQPQEADMAAGNPPGAPAGASTAISSGPPIDNVGGPGLGQPASEDDGGMPSQPGEKRAADPQDRRNDET